MARGIEVTEHLMSGEADDIPPPPITLRQWTERQVQARERIAYGRGYEQAREDAGGALAPVIWLLIGALMGAVGAIWSAVGLQ